MGKYFDGDEGVYFQPAHYGNWEDEALYDDTDNNSNTPDVLTKRSKMRPSDIRPFFHLLAAYQKSFCSKGWDFNSPVFETNWGRRLIFQALKDFGKADRFDSAKKFGIRASYTNGEFILGDTTIGIGVVNVNATLLKFDDDFTAPNFDAAAAQQDGYYNFSPSPPNQDKHYIQNFAGTHDITVSLDITLREDTRLNLVLVKTIVTNSPFVVGGSLDQIFIAPQQTLMIGPNQNVTHVFENIEILPNEVVRAYLVHFDLTFVNGSILSTIEPTTYWKTEPKKLAIKEGMFLPLGLLISPDFNFLELLSAGAHLIGRGLFITDVCTKSVTLYQENFVQMWGGAQPEAFYSIEEQGVAPRLVCDEQSLQLAPVSEKRFFTLKYQDADDKYITDVKLIDKENPPYSRTIDLGDDPRYTNDTEEDPNPLFEPTLDIRAEDLEHVDALDNIGLALDRAAELPALWDNSDFEPSEDVGPRILLVFGEAFQHRGFDGGQNQISAELEWEYDTQIVPSDIKNETIDRIPTASMCLQQQILSSQGLGPISPNENLAYGEKDRDLYMFWRLRIKELYESIGISHKALLSGCQFDSVDFRQLWDMLYEGQMYRAKLLGAEGFLSCGQEPMDLVLQSLVQDDYCYVELPCATLGVLGHNSILDIVTVTISSCDEYTISWGYLAEGNLPQFNDLERIPYQGPGEYFVSVSGCGCTNVDRRIFPI